MITYLSGIEKLFGPKPKMDMVNLRGHAKTTFKMRQEVIII